MRVYLPTTLAALGSALVAGHVGPAPVTGFAVTPALREWYASGDLEELEYIAMVRVVLAAELPESLISVKNGLDKPGQVIVTLPVMLTDVVSGHVDAMDAGQDIDAAAAALPAADAGDSDAKFIVDSAEGHELLWYATQELLYLIG